VSIERINPGELARPSGFSHAVAASGGRMVCLAGQTGYGPDGRIVDGGVVSQFERALANLLTALRAAGGYPADLVSLTIYAVDLTTTGRRSRDRQRGGGSAGEYPDMAAVGVSRSGMPTLSEVQGLAVARAPE
jgi:enamine deaminase RidA (YjgF/YER057c/UK114 family)